MVQTPTITGCELIHPPLPLNTQLLIDLSHVSLQILTMLIGVHSALCNILDYIATDHERLAGPFKINKDVCL